MLHFLSDHGAVLGLLALAFIVTMPDEPPANLRAVPGWLYRWMALAGKTFVSFRSPKPKVEA
jgi:hypothetical protein